MDATGAVACVESAADSPGYIIQWDDNVKACAEEEEMMSSLIVH